MEMIGYVVKNGFFEYMNKHHNFLDQIPLIAKEQLDSILEIPNELELCERAIRFFHNEAIYLKDHTVYYENKLKQATYAMRIEDYQIYLTPHEGNPFVPFLQRIYRNFVIMKKKESM